MKIINEKPFCKNIIKIDQKQLIIYRYFNQYSVKNKNKWGGGGVDTKIVGF